MTIPRTIPAPKPIDLITTTILVEGNAVPEEINVLMIAVTKSINSVSSARIAFHDGDPASENFELSAKEDFVPGKKIEIKAGYHSDETTIFKGIIVRHAVHVTRSGNTMLVLECKDEAVKMTVGRKNAYFYEQKDSEIISEIVGTYSGLSVEGKDTSVKHKEMVQYYSTDWDFVVARAEQNGMLVVNDDGKLKIGPPEMSQEPVLGLLFGATVIEFSGELDARMQYKSVKSVSWDWAGQSLLEMEAASPSFTETGNLSGDDLAKVIGLDAYQMHHGGRVSDQELQAWADAALLRSRMGKAQGQVSCQGVAAVKPGTVLELGGLGDRFNGKVFVAGVRQEIGPGKWETMIEFGLSPKWFMRRYPDINDLPAGGLLPGIHGLHIGKVVALEGDPDGEERIQVRMPTISTSEEGIWARLGTLDAGSNRGWVFRPEIDDEVVIGFLNADPRYPVVLGQLHSSAKASPIPAADDNHEKGLLTRAELKLQFNDDKKIITIETPKGNKIVLSEEDGGITIEDENGNKMVTSSSGIDMESPGAINIKASKDLSLEGMNVNIKASAQLKAEGSAGAELSAGGTCVVKGAVVQIN